MTTYTLTPTTMVNYPQAEGQTDVVFRVVWNYSGVDGTYTASFSGQTDLTYQAGTPFTPYANLTEDQVSGWVLAAWTPEQTAANQAQIDAAIALEKNPPTQVLPLPWAPPTPAENLTSQAEVADPTTPAEPTPEPTPSEPSQSS